MCGAVPCSALCTPVTWLPYLGDYFSLRATNLFTYLLLTPNPYYQYLDYHLSVCHFLMEESGEDFNESDAWQSGHEDWKNDSQANVSKCVQVGVWVGGADITQQCIAC